MSAIKMYENQLLILDEKDIVFTEKLIKTEVEEESEDEDEDEDSESEPIISYNYICSLEKFANSYRFKNYYEDPSNDTIKWICKTQVSNYEDKLSAASTDKDKFYLKWFKSVSKDNITDDDIFKVDVPIDIKENLSSFVDSETAAVLDDLKIKMHVEFIPSENAELNPSGDIELNPSKNIDLSSSGVLKCTIYNDVADNKDVYYRACYCNTYIKMLNKLLETTVEESVFEE